MNSKSAATYGDDYGISASAGDIVLLSNSDISLAGVNIEDDEIDIFAEGNVNVYALASTVKATSLIGDYDLTVAVASIAS